MTPGSPPFNAQERDIDLMLLEEMHCNPDFLIWMANLVGIAGTALHFAQHSVYREDGETDVLALLDTPEGRVALMIEDKIGAPMQPKQAERYRKRGEILCKEGNAVKFRTLLCAPKAYLLGVPPDDWDATLPFERIAEWFDGQNNIRAQWRRDTLSRAVKRQRRSTAGAPGSDIAVPDEALVKFKRDYWQYVKSAHPEFDFTEQVGRDTEYYFKGIDFPSHLRFKHSFSASTIVLVCEQPWKERAEQILPTRIPQGIENMWIKVHNSTLDLITGVEPIDVTESVESQTDLIDAAMDAAGRLLPYAQMVRAGALSTA